MNPSDHTGNQELDLIGRYWGKAGRLDDGGLSYHPLVYHCLDVAAVGQVLLQSDLSLLRKLTENFKIAESTLLGSIPFFLSLHDIGKFSEGFQNIYPDLFRRLRGRSSDRRYDTRHDSLGFLLWNDHLWERIWEEDWFRLRANGKEQPSARKCRKALEPWGRAVAGHHGEPPKEADGLRLRVSQHFGEMEKADAVTFARIAVGLFLTGDRCKEFQGMVLRDESRDSAPRACWLLAGLAVLCDWIGSDETYFPFRPARLTLGEYWTRYALRGAEAALPASGVLPTRVASRMGMDILFPEIGSPSPLQEYASRCPLAEGPQLFILEEATGAGKTEAALVLAHRLMANGNAEGIFIGLPTMATANAMYARVAEAYRRMFADSGTPSLVLAHSSRHLSKLFRDSILPKETRRTESRATGVENGAAQCAQWLGDSRKKAMLADAGAGTLDQVLLGALPSRHQSLRLLGVSRKVLIVDEVHSYDVYMLLLLGNLLRFHASLGGSAILLSATLPRSIRQRLADVFCEALGRPAFPIESTRYPLVTRVDRSAGGEDAVENGPGTKRTLSVNLVHDVEAVESLLRQTAREGRCACWVRNTVSDAIVGYDRLGKEIERENLLLFHGRFAMEDRLKKEEKVLETFGKGGDASRRRGKILIATQVVEQSLDLDFDVMVTDLAPIDLVVQRAGRLHRHPRDREGKLLTGPDRRDMREAPLLHIFSPPLEDDPRDGWYKSFFPRGANVYPDHGRLWLTARLLANRGGWRIPDDARDLLEAVYGEDPFEEIPRGLSRRSAVAEGQALANASVALMNSLKLDEGYAATPGQWLDDTKALTRLGDLHTTVRLARCLGKTLSPWSDAQRYAWDLSQVSVRSAWIHSEAIPPELQEEVDRAKETMPDRGKWSVLVPLFDLGNGKWRGQACDAGEKIVAVNYDKETGLAIERR